MKSLAFILATTFLAAGLLTASCARNDGMGDLFKSVGMVYGNDPYRKPCPAGQESVNNICRPKGWGL